MKPLAKEKKNHNSEVVSVDNHCQFAITHN